MLNDLKQPAKDWLADAMENLSGLLGDGDDPSFTLDVFGAEIEIRLNKLPGHFERVQIEVPNAKVEADGAASCAGRASNDGLGGVSPEPTFERGEEMRYLPDGEVTEGDIENACDELKDLMLKYLETRHDDDYHEAQMMAGYMGGLIDAMMPEDDDAAE